MPCKANSLRRFESNIIKLINIPLQYTGDQKHYCSDPGNNSLNGMNIYYRLMLKNSLKCWLWLI